MGSGKKDFYLNLRRRHPAHCSSNMLIAEERYHPSGGGLRPLLRLIFNSVLLDASKWPRWSSKLFMACAGMNMLLNLCSGEITVPEAPASSQNMLLARYSSFFTADSRFLLEIPLWRDGAQLQFPLLSAMWRLYLAKSLPGLHRNKSNHTTKGGTAVPYTIWLVNDAFWGWLACRLGS